MSDDDTEKAQARRLYDKRVAKRNRRRLAELRAKIPMRRATAPGSKP